MLSRINKELLPMKAHYFLLNAGTGPVQPFLSTYARQLGFSSVIVGIIYTILPISGMLAKPLVGAIADRFRCQKVVFLIGQLLTAAAFLAINFSPKMPVDRQVHFSCDVETVFDTSPNKDLHIDQYVLNQFQNKTESVDCDLNCPMEESFWKVIVENWKVDEYRDAHPNDLHFTAVVNPSKTINTDSVVYFSFNHVKINDKIYKPLCPCGNMCHISTICQMECKDHNLNNLVATSVSDQDVYNHHQFWIFLILMIFGWIGQAIAVSIGDAICFELLGDKPNRYGYQRMFGALGWGIFSVIAGVMVDSFSQGSSTKNFESAFYLSFVFLLLDFTVSSRITCRQKKQSPNILRDVGKLLTNLRIIVFLIWCIAVGMCTGLIWQFLFFLIEDLAKNQGSDSDSQQWIKTLEGIVMAVQTLLGEMPFFFLSGKILKRIGHINSMSLVLLVIGLRYIIYSLIPNPWWFLPVELLNGLTFGLFYACMASYASIVAPPGTEATMQGLVGAVFEGVGVSLGSFVGGLIYDDYGGPWTFRLFGIGALITCLLHAFVQYLFEWSGKKSTDYEAQYSSPVEALNILYDDQQELTLVGS